MRSYRLEEEVKRLINQHYDIWLYIFVFNSKDKFQPLDLVKLKLVVKHT